LGSIKKPWIDRRGEWNGDELHPDENMPNYGGDMAEALSTVALVLMLDIPQADKDLLAVRFTQVGIDFYGNTKSGVDYGIVGGGIGVGRKWPILFAGLMLDDAELKAVGSNYGPKEFQEDCQTHYLDSSFSQYYPGVALGTPVWGERHCVKAEISWVAEPGNTGYQDCCTANRWNGSTLAALMMNAKGLWNHDAFFDYTDRHMEFINHAEGWYRSKSSFHAAMWDTYRLSYGPLWSSGSNNDTTPPLPPTALTSSSQTENSITLSWTAPGVASDGDVASNYSVFRNGSFVSVVGATSYTDTNLSSVTSYDYAIYSNDNAGNQSTSAATGNFSTTSDTVGPHITTLQAHLNELNVVFSEPLDPVSAQSTGNYGIGGLSISSATLSADQHTVTLSTSTHQENTSYILAVGNVKDLDGNVMSPDNRTYQFLAFSLVCSPHADRSDPIPLSNNTISGNVYIYLIPESGVEQVRFYLDDPGLTGTVFQTENTPPFDFGGGSASSPTPFETGSVSDGAHTITVSFDLTNGETEVLQVPFTIGNSSNPNQSPVMATLSDLNVEAGAPITIAVAATDPDGDPLTYSASSLPVGANFNSATRVFSWTPTSNQAGNYVVLFTVADGNGGADTESVNIAVTSSNTSPQLSPIGSKNAAVGQLLQFEIQATDPDGDTMTYFATGLPSGAIFDPSTRQFTWTPSVSQQSEHQVTFTVTDGNGGNDFETISITVTSVNSPPQLTPIGPKTVLVGSLLDFTVQATDVNNDTLTYTVSSIPVGATFDTGVQRFTWTPTTGQLGDHLVTFIVSDGNGGSDAETITITVTADNDTLLSNGNWQSMPVATQSGQFVISYDVIPQASVVDGVIGLSDGEAGAFNDLATITRFSPSGFLDVRNGSSYTAANSIPYEAGKTFRFRLEINVSSHIYSVYVTPEGENEQVLALNYAFRTQQAAVAQLNQIAIGPNGPIYVENVQLSGPTPNNPPVLAPIGSRTVVENELLTFQISATDIDGDPLSYTAAALPGDADFDTVTRTFTWTPTVDDSGTYDITFGVSDGIGQDSEQITITVADFNRPPVLATIPDVTSQAGQTVMFPITAIDPDSDVLEYTAENMPPGATMVDQTFIWVDNVTTGVHVITFIVVDRPLDGLEDRQDVTITITDVPNAAPTLTPLADQSIDENSTLSFTVEAQDADGDPLTYSVSGLPVGAIFDAQVFSWTPTFDQSGIYPMIYTVDDGVDQVSQNVSISVLNVNRPPVLEVVADQSGPALEALTFSVIANDPDGDTITYSIPNLPNGASFIDQSFAWTPGLQDAGSYQLNVVVSDGDLEDSQQIVLTIETSNIPPVFDPIDNIQVDENTELSLPVQASDENGDTLTYNVLDLPEGATFDNQVFHWIPTFDQAGDYTITFTVSDGQLSGVETVTVTVSNINRPPVLDPIAQQTVFENNLLSLAISAIDPDGDTLTYSAPELPQGATFANAFFQWTPDFDAMGTYSVSFTVSDGEAEHSLTAQIQVENTNRAPVLEPLSDQTTTEGDLLALAIQATDPDGDVIVYSTSTLPTGAQLINNIFNWIPSDQTAGMYPVTFYASDGDLQAQVSIVLTVNSPVNTAPEIEPIGNKSVKENDLLEFEVNTIDQDSDPVQVMAQNLPNGATFSNGQFSWTPDFKAAGNHPVSFAADDGTDQTVESITITVQNTNRKPKLNPHGRKKIKENAEISFSISATDPDEDPVSYSADALPSGSTFEDNTFSWNPDYDDSGLHLITFMATDGDLLDTQTVEVEVDNVNRAPVMDPVASLSVSESETVIFDVQAIDPDGDSVSISAQSLPDGADFSNQQFQWTPDFDDAGNHEITMQASDGDLSDFQTIIIVVGSTNRPPVFDPIADQALEESVALTFVVRATDPDGDDISYRIINLPDGATFSQDTFGWTPEFDQSGHYSVTFVADDGSVEVYQTISMMVNNMNRPPVLTQVSDPVIQAEQTVTQLFQASDPDGDEVTLTIQGLPEGSDFDGSHFTWTPTRDNEGQHVLIIVASDGALESQISLIITVMPGDNRPPIFEPMNPQTISENTQLFFNIQASDPDGNPLTFSADGLPAGAQFSGQSLIWTPGFEDEGIYPVTFTVTDGLETASLTLSITVTNTNRAPLISFVPNQFIKLGETAQFQVDAYDEDGDPVIVSIENLPTGADFESNAFSWTPSSLQSGVVQVSVVASDGQLQSRQVVHIYVSNDPTDSDPPVLLSVSPPDESTQVERNSLASFTVVDNDSGVDGSTVEVILNDTMVYQGDTNIYSSPLGKCRRSGDTNHYTYTFQPLVLFDNDQMVEFRFRARDLSGNVMPEHISRYSTEMHTFGLARQVNANSNALCGQPVSLTDAEGNLWFTWHDGPVGQRNIHVSRLRDDSRTFDIITTVSQNDSDQINPSLGINADGNVFVCWQEDRRGNWDIYVSNTSDGVAWSVRKRLTDLASDQVNPVIAADGNKMFVAWQDNVNGNQDIYVATSTNAFSNIAVKQITRENALQIDPALAVVNGKTIIVWTDLRHASTDLYGASSETGWNNVPLVTHAANQSQAAVIGQADTDQLHMVWMDDRNGNNDIYYASLSAWLATSPLEGINLVDDTTARQQSHPTVMSSGIGNDTRVYVAWQDQRHVVTDHDIYFVTIQSDLRTNVLVTAESENAHQSEPALGINPGGDPYLVWVDQRNNDSDVYFSGITNVAGEQVVAQDISAITGGVVGTPVENIDSADDVSAEVPVGAFSQDVTLTISYISNPVSTDNVVDILAAYDFGPSANQEFARPITLTLPYEVDDPDAPTDVFWYNPQTGELSQTGLSQIETIEISPTLRAMRFNTTHFSQYLVGEIDASKTSTDRRQGAGGCSLTRQTEPTASLLEFLLPLVLLTGVIFGIRRRDSGTRPKPITLRPGK
jgi:hypothetical protein